MKSIIFFQTVLIKEEMNHLKGGLGDGLYGSSYSNMEDDGPSGGGGNGDDTPTGDKAQSTTTPLTRP